ncbi:AT-rich interactive domain-containing protein 2 isoform X1 [Lucilia cuprina]|uniref:AT-rich interactive domain-containing protein 2 isoform X1 n=1 Tax=Lucilia cuprina TaxID=7375 RepID=UPI001F05DA1D|nr:AT-rich interactive domain-containing protein 2 isoform X1 [Lucilia cuprina]
MLLNDSMKSSNISQLTQNDGSTNNASATNTIGVITASTASASASSGTTTTGTPLRSRNNNRDRQQSDEKQDSSNIKGKNPPKPMEEFYKDLQQFHEKRGTPIMHMPKITGRQVDLHRLYCEVTERGGFQKVNMRDEWDEILPELGLKEKIVNGSAALKYIYRRVLEKYECLNYFGEDPDKVDALAAAEMNEFNMGGGRGRGSRHPTSYSSSNPTIIHSVAMSYNYRQHHVNMDRRRQFKLSTDLHKPSPYEKLMLSLLSPLPNEQDFAINACTLMANEARHTLKLNEFPKLLDALLAHTGVFSDYTMRKLFQHIYSGVRHHSLYGFWFDLLSDKPQILDLYTDEQSLREAALIDDYDDGKPEMEGIWQDRTELDFLNLRTGLGTQDYVGQRVLQVVSILRNLSFQEENLGVLVKNKTFLRFLVMSSNIRWSNVHIQALEIAGNIAGELEILDPTIDDLSRCLMATICDGIEGPDRGVIINCLEILYKLCQKDTNEDYVLKCLNNSFYNTICLFLSLNDIMMLLFTLEAIYALTCLGPKSCHSMMQVKGIVDQLISLITVEGQAYGPDGCILMRVVETVPAHLLPTVAENISNLQNVAHMPQILTPNPMHVSEIPESVGENIQQAQQQQQQHQTQQQLQMPQNFTHDDEQYALAWLGATFERAPNVSSFIETQELYRMYLSHCQKSGKHSVVNHLHFPKLVRLIFTAAIGPTTVKKVDGTELPGLHYVAIRLRAQPLPLQKSSLSVSTGPISPSGKHSESPGSARKIKKKIKQQTESPVSTTTPATLSVAATTATPQVTTNTGVAIASDNPTTATSVSEPVKQVANPVTPIISQATAQSVIEKRPPTPQQTEEKKEEKMDVEEKIDNPAKLENPTQTIVQSVPEPEPMQIVDTTSVIQPAMAQNPSSLIKSLLANKVNQRQMKQKDITASSNNTTATTTSVPTTTAQPIKMTTTAITALVNNPLMQHTPVKVGQTTIKPLNPHPPILDKKPQISESTPPPLAPLSGANVAKDASGRPIILANQMLVDILDKKMVDPPIPTSIIQKRKIEDNSGNNKRLAMDTNSSVTSAKEEPQVTPSKNAANLYAEMAASILEDEDLEEFSTQTQQQPPQPQLEQQQIQQTSLIIPAKVQQQQTTAAPLQGVQRQLVFQSNQPQLKLTQPVPTTSQQIPNAMATIKTDHGLQTVPVILQQKPMEVQQQGQTQIIQQMMQPAAQQQQTYVLATNQQGQTYLVAQQTQPHPPPPPPQPTQTVLVTQTPQQQSTGQKTIIILQQQPMPGQQQQIITTGPPGQGQKMIMTTSQGQQVLVTQRPQTPQQIFINPQTGTATHIQHMPMQTQTRQIIQTTNPPQQQQTTQIQAGQISPSLLNQLNQIPATIKLHQPIAQHTTPSPQPQPATITRMAKTVSLVQSSNTPAAPVAIPQLQQHQSIIQQHIISGPSEKRHVILSGGAATAGGVGMRAIEIKETVITQAQQPPQQQQLNSQTIITTQQPPQGTVASTTTPPLLQQQVQQQIRAVIEQQQHPSIIQQKISSLPVVHQQQQQQQPQASSSLTSSAQQQTKMQNQVLIQANIAASKHKTSLSQQQLQTPTLKAAKQPDPTPSLIQSKSVTQTHNVTHTTAPSIPIMTQSPGVGNIKKPPTLIKPSLPTVKLPPIVNNQGPPPLAVVNNTATANNSSGNAPAPMTTEVNKKEETIKTQTAAPTQGPLLSTSAAKPNPTQTPQTLTTSATSTASTTTSSNNAGLAQPPSNQNQPQLPTQPPPQPTNAPLPVTAQAQQPPQQLSTLDAQWLYICDWRNCPRKKFKSMGDLQHHVCTSHAPDHLDPAADIFCQWGVGPGLCDGVPRKRFSLMTHLIDHHLTLDSLRTAVQRRIATGMYNITPAIPPVTIVRNIELSQRANNASPSPSNSSSSSSQTQSTTGLSALQAIKRHTTDLMNSKELMDENEGPVTKSIRLTASLILRNLVTYTSTAKRSIRRYEPHLANIALSNVESSVTISHILYEMNG